MKVLSIRQPWAWLCAAGIKNIENRTWSTRYRGPILIHAASKFGNVSIYELRDQYGFSIDVAPPPLEMGGIIGRAEIVDCVEAHPSKWFEGPYGFVLRNALELPFWPMRGRLSLFEPPKELIESAYAIHLRE